VTLAGRAKCGAETHGMPNQAIPTLNLEIRRGSLNTIEAIPRLSRALVGLEKHKCDGLGGERKTVKSSKLPSDVPNFPEGFHGQIGRPGPATRSRVKSQIGRRKEGKLLEGWDRELCR